MTVSLILFVLFVLVYLFILDIITILFRLTGLTEEKARFQVISLLTNSGFTTQESEVIVSTPIRRKLAKATMIFGYSSTVTIMSTVVNFFMSLDRAEMYSFVILIPISIGVLCIAIFLRKSRKLKKIFDTYITNVGNKIMFGGNTNPVVLLDDYGDMVVAQVYVNKVPGIFKNTTLADSGLKENKNILVMMIKSRGQEAQIANADTVLVEEDIIIVLGTKETIKAVFEKV